MQLSMFIGASALVLTGVLATGHAFGQDSTSPRPPTAQEKLDQREAQRRAEVAEQQKRKEDFARNCIKRGLSNAELEACRAVYRRL